MNGIDSRMRFFTWLVSTRLLPLHKAWLWQYGHLRGQPRKKITVEDLQGQSTVEIATLPPKLINMVHPHVHLIFC
jgi:hypothetical protein